MSQFLSKKKKIIIFLLVVLALFGAFFFIPIKQKSDHNRIGKVQRESLLQQVTIAGVVEPVRTSIVTAAYDGYVKKLFVGLGQKVKEGEPLVSVVQSLQAAESVFPVRAPFAGTVTQVMKLEGQFVKKSDAKDFILRVDDLNKIFINANAPEIEVLKIKTSSEAVVKISAILDGSYKGIVREISSAANPKDQWQRNQVEFSLKIEVIDADFKMKPGMTAIVDIITAKRENVLTLRHEFIQKEVDQYFVTLKNGARTNIKVGLQNESAFEITEGLSEGQEVRPVDFLKIIQEEES